MTLFRRFLRRFTSGTPQPIEEVDLVSIMPIALQAPAKLNIPLQVRDKPWSVARLHGIFLEFRRTPGIEADREARYARHCLSSFWLTAPVDQLEVLYSTALGELQRELLAHPLCSAPLASDEALWRDRLAQRLASQHDCPERTNLLLAVMPYFSPGLLRIPNPLQQVPQWLLPDYSGHCEPSLETSLRRPAGLLASSSPAQAISSPSCSSDELKPSAEIAGPVDLHKEKPNLPTLSRRESADAMELFRSEAAVNRMAALINLYTIDPKDPETLKELAGLRRIIGQLWLNVEPQSMEALYRSGVGTVYRSLLRCGFGSAPLTERDLEARGALAAWVQDLNQPRAVNAMLAVLPFYPPGKIRLVGGQECLPSWLISEMAHLTGTEEK
ncbi:MAG: hypothetical protein ACOVQK_10055 [Cyanobium sp.]|jgi:hypothetical protein